MSKTEKRKTGDLGEKIAGRFLVSRGFEIVGWNYLKPWGEIDIIIKKKSKIHFIEVKTVKVRGAIARVSPTSAIATAGKQETKPDFFSKIKAFVLDKEPCPEMTFTIKEVSQETEKEGVVDEYRPEDNLHPWKLKRLKRAIQSYLAEKRMSEEDDWQFDAVTVRINEEEKIALVEYLEDIIL
jgi:Holliday junction resolvase-like predicted endonuclease